MNKKLYIYVYLIYILVIHLLYFVYIISSRKYKLYSIGYFPNHVTGLFTKLIGIASLVGLSIIKKNKLISNLLYLLL